ncbi:sigma-70 family RNA polymerase sigma factor [Dactylosporangium sucinum]|uniref:RNA polymerase sigma factor SigL n=1 Tax=Dactylosporangium sucinum TaxID=1424081 RepID=A0A917X434_9ACTN|nr:sigma-70 family RNA polymerase sigma factor [Dactylosporangium sucinum]GGM63328.1 RNA polymerase sigma factor SigL [Dactylosporangium sucinum]
MAGHVASNPSSQPSPAQPGSPTGPAAMADTQLAKLHELHSNALLKYLVKLTLGDSRLAEDILQETFVRAWRHLSRYDDTDLDAFRPWLYTVARRLVVDMLRSRKSRPAEVMVDDLARLSVADDTIGNLVSAHAVRDALMRLRPEHRIVLIQLYYYGRSPSEVAEMLDIPLGTVKSRAYYAKQALRSHLDQ